MQPPNLIAVGVSAVLAVGAVGTSPATAETYNRHHRTTPVAASEAAPPNAPATASERSTSSSGATDNATVVGQRSLNEVNRDIDARFDQLQLQNEVQQQLNQDRLRPLPNPASNSLLLDQQLQQQLNQQRLQQMGQPQVGPMRSLERLQFEQRVRQQLNRPAPAVPAAEPTSNADSRIQQTRRRRQLDRIQAAIAAAEIAQAEGSSGATAASATPQPQPTPSQPAAAQPDAAPDAVEAKNGPAPAESAPAPEQQPEQQTESTASEAQRTAEPTDPTVETTVLESASPEPAETEPADADDEADEADETAAEPESAEATEAAEATEESEPESAEPEAAEEPEETEAATDDSTSDPAEESAQTPESVETPFFTPDTPEPTPADAETPAATAEPQVAGEAAPEYLDPNPNPLFFPTEPEEVEIVGTQPITLRQAVELAVRNNPDLREARITLERTQADLRNAEASNYPTLDATAQFNQAGQESPVQEPAILGFDPQTGQPIPNPNAGETDIVTSDSTALGAGLELSYPIFTSGRRPALINAAAAQVRFQELEVERQTEQLILDTVLDYYDLQQAGAQVNIFRANLEQAEQSLRDAQALERAGVGTRFDVLQAEVDVANARQDLTQQLSQLEIARRQLVQRLNLAQSVDISAADPIEVAGVWELGLDESIVQAYKNRVELEQQLVQRDIAQQNRRAALAQLGPQVSFSGAFNLNNDLDQDNGFLYSYQLGVGLRLSLYDGGAARSQANREESNIAIAETQFEAARDQIRFQVEQAYAQLDANFANIQTTALAVEQATEALRLARLRFQAGVGTQTDVLRQQSALTEAQVNNLRAILDYNRALATLQRAISNYPDGFLSDVP